MVTPRPSRAASSPGIVLVKSAVPNNVTAAGDTVTYSFAVTNTGNVTLSSVAVTDPMPDLSPITCPSTSLAPSATIVCTATYVAKLADIDAGSINNTATTTGTPPIGTPVSDTDTETVTATTSPAIQVVKSASPTNVTAAGQVVTYSFRVINTGNVTLSAITVGDPLPDLGPITCPTTSLAPGLDMICTAAYTVAQGDVDAGSITNTASVTGTPPAGATVGDTDTAIVIATQTSDVSIVKSANPTVITAAGQPVAYSFLVTNTGNVTLSGIGVFDPLPGLGTVTCPSTTLAPGGSTTCTAGYTASQADIDLGSIDNTATVVGDASHGSCDHRAGLRDGDGSVQPVDQPRQVGRAVRDHDRWSDRDLLVPRHQHRQCDALRHRHRRPVVRPRPDQLPGHSVGAQRLDDLHSDEVGDPG